MAAMSQGQQHQPLPPHQQQQQHHPHQPPLSAVPPNTMHAVMGLPPNMQVGKCEKVATLFCIQIVKEMVVGVGGGGEEPGKGDDTGIT